jgi:hypothetical protein
MLEAKKRYVIEEEATLREMDREALMDAKLNLKEAEKFANAQPNLVF